MNAQSLSLLIAGLVLFGSASAAPPANPGLPSRVTKHAQPAASVDRARTVRCDSIAIARLSEDGMPLQAQPGATVHFSPAVAAPAGTVARGTPLATRRLDTVTAKAAVDPQTAVYAKTLVIADEAGTNIESAPAYMTEDLTVACLDDEPVRQDAPTAAVRKK
ncbi:hypothetical protein [Pseudomonas sp. CGJS7]|uniref:hypothetical protein n=1 Tax=Pseudomonas sp. CGJS7 TaxID=3109348 RepID=UPI00300BE136